MAWFPNYWRCFCDRVGGGALALVLTVGLACSQGDGDADTSAASSTGGPEQCLTCNELLSGKAGMSSFVCAGAADDAFGALVSCACDQCEAECSDTLCQNVPPTDACRDCFGSTCAAQIETCMAN